jgi:hypothetical protein
MKYDDPASFVACLVLRQLAIGIAEMESTARALRDQAEQLASLGAKFTFEESHHPATAATRRVTAPRPVAAAR